MRLGFHDGSPFELQAATWDDAGHVALWAVPNLVLLAELRLAPFVKVAAVCVRTGTVVTSRSGANGAPLVEVRRIDGGAVVGSRQMGALVASAVHEDSGRLALVSANELVVVDTATGALRRRTLGRFSRVVARRSERGPKQRDRQFPELED